MSLPISLGLYVLADLCEIGGGYLAWLWFREGRPLGQGIARATILILYGIIPTFQAAHLAGLCCVWQSSCTHSARPYKATSSYTN